MSFLPLVILNSVLIPLLSPSALKFWRGLAARVRRKGPSLHWPRFSVVLVHVCLSLIVSQMLLYGYRQWYGSLAEKPAAYLYTSGFFILADLSPLVKPIDYPIPSQREAIFGNLKFDLRNPENRFRQRWEQEGLCGRIAEQWKNKDGDVDLYLADKAAEATAIHAMLRNPVGVVRLALYNFSKYFDGDGFEETLHRDEGAYRELSQNFREILKGQFNLVASRDFELSPIKNWHFAAMPWYQFLLCFLAVSPIFLWWCRPDTRPLVVLCVIAALLFMEGAILTVERPTARYLTTAAWLVLLMIGASSDLLIKRQPSKPPSTPEAQEQIKEYS